MIGVLRDVEVVATRHGRLWRLTYADPCTECGKRHFHAGGDGDAPVLGDGTWYSHCLSAPADLPLVRLVLRGRDG